LAERGDAADLRGQNLTTGGARVEKLLEREEGVQHRLTGPIGVAVATLAILTTLFHLYAAYDIVATYLLRPIHVGLIMILIFVSFPAIKAWRDRVRWWDLIAVAATILVIFYLVQGGDDLTDRASLPNSTDMAMGALFTLLVLEATRRSTGWIMPGVAVLFLMYAVFGQALPPPWTHRGYDLDRLIGHLYMTLEGIFGVAVDVSSSLIILFTIFGAVLQFSGAGKFFIDFSFAAMGGKASSAGRAVVLSSFLLGGPSGSGVATTVTLGAVAAPMLIKVGYGRNAAGGLLAAGGLGAILSPPVLGAAAFLIAEFLKLSYLDVIRMAVVPTLLYYLALFVMVELDSGRFGIAGGKAQRQERPLRLLRTHGFHFTSLLSIIVLMIYGLSPVLSVFWATVLAVAVSYLRRDSALRPRKLAQALAAGTVGVLAIAATCATAGIIVGVVTLTGLGLKFSAIAIAYAGGSLTLTAIYTALIVWIVGLAVPVTASYIICAVIAAPAMIQLGVPDFAAHMFIFYYAVLSEVSPPTALSPFAAAAITGGEPYATTLQSWKYTMPAFLVPFIFVLDPLGVGLLLSVPKGGGTTEIVWIGVMTALGIVGFAIALQGWLLRPIGFGLRIAFAVAATCIAFPGVAVRFGMEPLWARPTGLVLGGLLAIYIGLQRMRARAAPGTGAENG
jgi:TRAP transporter 4TM/12TM fusion protein